MSHHTSIGKGASETEQHCLQRFSCSLLHLPPPSSSSSSAFNFWCFSLGFDLLPLLFSQVLKITMEISEGGILDIESLTLPPNKCSESPKMTKALSRKGSCRMERRGGEEQDGDGSSKKLLIKVCSQMEQLKQPIVPNKAISATPIVANGSNIADAGGEGKIKRFNRLMKINPRRILLLFASMSSMGTMILIYFTLAIYRRDASER